MADAAIIKCDDYSEGEVTRALTEALAQFDIPVKSGTRVVVKANLVSGMSPDSAATTHPSLLCALVRILRRKGAAVVVGDSPGGLYNAVYVGGVYSLAGMGAVEKAGAVLNRNFGQAEAVFPAAEAAKNFSYTSYLDDADIIINFSKLKTHGMMGMSAAVKNMFGAVPGTEKPEYHFKYPTYSKFADMLIDLNEYFHPCLSIIDAVTAMEGNGPTMGAPRHVGAVIASPSPYYADLVGAKLIGLSMRDVPTLEQAFKRSLAPESPDTLDIYGDPDEFAVSDFKASKEHRGMQFQSHDSSLFGKVLPAVIRAAMCSVPKLTPKLCIHCEKCIRICPAKAISLKNSMPAIDRSKCIRCFCCQEFCPAGAMQVHRPLPARILNK